MRKVFKYLAAKTLVNIFNLLYFSLVILLSLAVAWLACEVYKHEKNLHTNAEPLEQYIVSALTDCSTIPNNNPCYKKVAATIEENYNLQEAFTVLEKNEKNSAVFSNCHSTLHFLGQAVYKKNHNVTKALESGNPVCFAGYYHGVLEAYLTEKQFTDGSPQSYKSLTTEVPHICGDKPETNIKIYYECLHGLGHALMFATDTDLPSSLMLCDNLLSEQDRQWCYSGAFMENSTSSTNPDHPSKYLDKNNPLYPCTILQEKYQGSCYMLQSFYFAELSKYDWVKTADMCRKVPPSFQAGCFNALGQSLVGFSEDPTVIQKNCLAITEDNHKDNCIAGAVGAINERYSDGLTRDLNFCKLLNSPRNASCYFSLLNVIQTISPTHQGLVCSGIADDSTQTECKKRITN